MRWGEGSKGDYVAVPEATGNTLTITVGKCIDYECLVSDGWSTRYCSFWLQADSGLTVDYDNSVKYAELNEEVTLSVDAKTVYGDEIEYQWYRSEDYKEIEGANEASYTFNVEDTATYTCEISDGYGFEAVDFEVRVNTGLKIEEDSENFVKVENGADAVLEIHAETGEDYGPVEYVWREWNAEDWGWEATGKTDSYFNVSDATEVKKYSCIVSDKYNKEEIVFFVGSKEAWQGTAPNWESAVTVYTGETVKAIAPMGFMSMWLKFVPEQDGSYTVYTECDGWNSAVIYLYDEDREFLKLWNAYRTENLTYDFTAGTAYYLECRAMEGETVDYSVTIEQTEGDCNHSYPEVWTLQTAADCTKEGMEYRECALCQMIQTRVIQATGHSYGDIQTSETDTQIREYQVCSKCGDSVTVSVSVKGAEADKVSAAENAMKELEEGTTADVSSAVDAVVSMDSQLLIDMEETKTEGSSTAMDMVISLEEKLIADSTGITGTIAASGVKEDQEDASVISENVSVSGAAVTVAKVLKDAAASDEEAERPVDGYTYSAELTVTNTTTENTEPGVYSIDISMNVIATDTENETSEVFAEDVQPAAPIYITIPVPTAFWNGTFELLHNSEKVSYERLDNQVIGFYAASLSPWQLAMKECGEDDHDYAEDLSQAVEATCKATGMRVKVCTICSDKKTEIIQKAAHSWGNDEVLKAATCTEAGSQGKVCAVCKATKDVTEIPSKGGHSWKTVVDKAATCGAAGSQHKECTVCKAKQTATSIAATGQHTYGAYSVTTAPTVLSTGWETAKCNNCTATTGREAAKLEGTIALTSSSLKLQIKKSVNLTSLVTGLSEGDSIKSWTVDKKGKSCVTLTNKGKVTGKKAGTAKITVTLASGVSAVITLTVQKKAVTTSKVTVAENKIELNVGKSTTLKPIITPISSFEKVTYKTSNKKIVTVNAKGKITAKAPGKATITIKSGKKSVKVTVTVPAPELKSIKLSAVKKTLKKGKSFTLKVTLNPKGAADKITYATSNKKVATVNKKGKVTAKGKGTAIITVKAGEFTKTCKITVK